MFSHRLWKDATDRGIRQVTIMDDLLAGVRNVSVYTIGRVAFDHAMFGVPVRPRGRGVPVGPHVVSCTPEDWAIAVGPGPGYSGLAG